MSNTFSANSNSSSNSSSKTNKQLSENLGQELKYIDHHLHFDNVSLLNFIQKERTSSPFYIYNLKEIIKRLQFLRSFLPEKTQVHYAMKANFHHEILKLFKNELTGLDIVSGGEIQKALNAGFRGSDLLFSGVSKTKKEIRLALENNCKLINIECPEELVRVAEIASDMNKKAAVAFRLNPDVNPVTHPYITTGFRDNKFGMDFSFLDELRSILKKHSSHLSLCGLTLHIGSQMTEFSALEEALKKTIPIYSLLKKEGFPLESFDVGGGIGIPYNEKDPQVSLEKYGDILKKHLSPLGCEILIEPGRFLVGPCGLLISEVQYIKKTPHKNFVMLDTGIHHLLRPALYGAQHRILPLKENPQTNKNEKIEKYDVVGPICESADVLGRNIPFRGIKSGDFVAILDTGAYGYSMASHYNSRDLPEEIILGLSD